MKLKTIQKTLAIGVLAVTSSYAMQASAAPIFSFTEYGGFTGGMVPVADYSDPVVGDASVVPAVGDLYSTMSWNNTGAPQSSLELTTVTGPADLAADTWTTISHLVHNNVVIPNAADWGPQDIWGRLVITDSDGGDNVALDSDDVITIGLTETTNSTCAPPNPVGTICDDFFSFTAVGLADLPFTANDGSNWIATFRFANLVNAEQIGATIYTGEGQSSSLDVQVMVSAAPTDVPEPATLSILGLGLLGLGMMKRRKQNS